MLSFTRRNNSLRRMVSRGANCMRALAFYLQVHRRQSITDALNQVYADEPGVPDPALHAAQTALLATEDW